MVAPLIYDATLIISCKFAKGEFVVEFLFNTWLRSSAFVVGLWVSIDKQKYSAKGFISVQKVKLAKSHSFTTYSY